MRLDRVVEREHDQFVRDGLRQCAQGGQADRRQSINIAITNGALLTQAQAVAAFGFPVSDAIMAAGGGEWRVGFNINLACVGLTLPEQARGWQMCLGRVCRSATILSTEPE